MKRYSENEKLRMIDMYKSCKSYVKAAAMFGCACSTVYYAVNPDKYEHHKDYVYYMNKRGK